MQSCFTHCALRRRTAFVLSLACVGLNVAPVLADYRYVRVADTRDGALSLASDRQAVINNAGSVAFYASPSPGLNAGYFSGVGGAVSTIVTDSHPMLAGEGFALRSPSYNDSGQIAFFADRATVDGFRIYRADAGGALALIASTGAGTLGGIQDRPSINNSGNVAFHRSGVFGGAYIGNGSGEVKVYGFPDDLEVNGAPSLNNVGTMSFPALVGLAGGELKHLKGSGGGTFEVIASGSANGVSGFNPSVINDSGLVVYGAFANSTTGIYSGAGGSLVTTLVTTEGPFSNLAMAPGGGAGGFPTLNNAGSIAFAGTLDAGGSGIFTGADPITSRVIGDGTTLFGRSVVDFFGGLSREALNDAGEIAFQAKLFDGVVHSEVVVKAIPSVAMKWSDDSDGVWSDAGNWLGPVPNAYHHDANFTDAITAPRTVTVDGAFTVGSINFDSAHSYTIAGSGTITLNDSYQSLINVSTGTHTIDAPLKWIDVMSTSIGGHRVHVADGATLKVERTVDLPDLVILKKGGAGTMMMMNGASNGGFRVDEGILIFKPAGGTNRINTVDTTGPTGVPYTGKFDLNDNDLILMSSSVTETAAAVVNARNGGAWDGGGITSSTARTHPSAATMLGVMSGADYESVHGVGALFGPFTVASTDTLVKYTWYGDADFNGIVDFDDYVRTDAGYNFGLSGWINGDFDLNEVIDFDDYVLIDLGFNSQSGTLRQAQTFLDGSDRDLEKMTGPALESVVEHFEQFGVDYASHFLSAVPEPGSALVGGVFASATILTRRKRKSRPATS